MFDFQSDLKVEKGAMETPQMSQRGNVLKTGFEEFLFYFGKSLKTGKC